MRLTPVVTVVVVNNRCSVDRIPHRLDKHKIPQLIAISAAPKQMDFSMHNLLTVVILLAEV